MSFIVLLALWVVVMSLVTYLFCGAAREFVSSPEVELQPLKSDGANRLAE